MHPLARWTPAVLGLVCLLAPGAASAQCELGDTDTGIPCGDIPSQGCCADSSTVLYCNGETLCQDDCLISDCGWESLWGVYDCTLLDGGMSDPTGLYPYSCGAAGSIDSGGGGIVDTGEPCGSILWEGCCDGQTLYFCDAGSLYTIDCTQNTTADGQFCGWASAEGYDCYSEPIEGALPRTCPGATCEPDCGGRDCGDDGCGGTCGVCPAGATCNAAGICEADCVPECGDRVCGPDPVCGISCGTCPAGLMCNTSLNECVASCTPSCAGKECGDNGCGGQCGVCPGDAACQDFRCVSTCVPSCAGKECGDDGCGGTCGTCSAGESCQAGRCVGCVPDCERHQCGPDGCGGTCGTCAAGQICDPQFGICTSDPNCVPQCADRECGDNGCGGMCGSCGIDFECYEGHCVTCAPDCEGRECGDDGCGGTCGECPEGARCRLDGLCTTVGASHTDAGATPGGPDAAIDAGGTTPPDDEKPGSGDDPTAGDDPTGGDDPAQESCPAGQERRYGICVTGDLTTPSANEPAAVADEATSGCSAGAVPTAFPWFLALLFAALPVLRRRRAG